ncbi:acyl-CoA dehydrogenase [Salaquimonas pukyongi]|uniref:acyl-CoA dehydrogenase n=1 Tax=Salaquimonas pukyongi TaxID=2712698 RepID=UPI00096BAA80|nr:acyl-CoA dehydrogenase [Salaquimonas pukyongi]
MYRAPVSEIAFALKIVAGMKEAMDAGTFPALSEDLVDAVLEEAGKFASDRIAPLNSTGDETGSQIRDAVVTTPEGWKETYKAWSESGWNAIAAPEAYGGQELGSMMALAASEMWNSASMAWALCPLLTVGAIEALDKHGSEELKDRFLARIVSGEWTGTMNLTEPQAGTDLAALKTRAEPREDGTYRIFGQKIFITYGEHDMTDNICHLVLARLPDAPAGTRGISLFLVPKFMVGDDGTLGERNDVFCQSIEHKLGIHASPTCVMIYGDGFEHSGVGTGAIGYLIGEENRGLNCMFTMMNNARLNVGIQGVAIAEAAYQHALAYAHERKQGKAPGYAGDGMSPIVEHPDVMRNLLTMKSMIRAARGICYSCAHALDMAKAAQGDEKKHWTERANLLTPIAKAFSTDIGCEVASIGVQVHGGMGFIEETGAAQFLRDARINPIYEGTNGVQAIDLVTRKLPLSDGEAVFGYIEELRGIAESVRGANHPEFGETADRLNAALDDVEDATKWMLSALKDGKVSEALAGATPYLRLFGLAAGGAYLAKAGLSGPREEHAVMARFFADNFLGETAGLKVTATEGAQSLLSARRLLETG